MTRPPYPLLPLQHIIPQVWCTTEQHLFYSVYITETTDDQTQNSQTSTTDSDDLTLDQGPDSGEVLIETTEANGSDIKNALDEKASDEELIYIILATCVSIIMFLICIAFGLCAYIKKNIRTNSDLNEFELAAHETPKSLNSEGPKIDSVRLQSMSGNMLDILATPGYKQSTEREKLDSGDECEELYIEGNSLMNTVNVTIDQPENEKNFTANDI